MPSSSNNATIRTGGEPGAIVAGISREIVGIYAEYYGRGPTKAKTQWREGIVVCVLEDIFGPAERILLAAGRDDQVRSHRQALHDTIEPFLRAAVERATGRQVRSCLSQVSADDIAAEIFVLGERLPQTASAIP